MSAQRKLSSMRRLFREVWNEGKLETIINELLEDDARHHCLHSAVAPSMVIRRDVVRQ
jgi:hypothetical protein